MAQDDKFLDVSLGMIDAAREVITPEEEHCGLNDVARFATKLYRAMENARRASDAKSPAKDPPTDD